MMMMMMIMIVMMATMTPQPQPQLFQLPDQETEMMILIHMIHMKTEIHSMIVSLGEEIWNTSL